MSESKGQGMSKTTLALAVTSLLVGVFILNANRPRIIENVIRVDTVPQDRLVFVTVPQEAFPPSLSTNDQPTQFLRFERPYTCTSIGVVEDATQVSDNRRSWRATIGGVRYGNVGNLNRIHIAEMKRRIKNGQLVCVNDPENNLYIRPNEIRVLVSSVESARNGVAGQELEDTTSYLNALALVRLPASTPMGNWKEQAEFLDFLTFAPENGEYLTVISCASAENQFALCTTRGIR